MKDCKNNKLYGQLALQGVDENGTTESRPIRHTDIADEKNEAGKEKVWRSTDWAKLR